ncbi:hypothetical protein WME90_05230 [Sorangium sp. So ce375]|uniref:hypothetical protein n=1 Tax=Sorangium sp. So ce375 TaxID=3133306 RepID=UPI003F5C602B
MRTALRSALLASFVALAGASACGGAVVVDGLPGGSESTGDAGATGGPQSSSSGGPSRDEQRASCDQFCSLFDGVTCPELRCRARCADLLSEQRPCNALTAPFFDCAGETIASVDQIPCSFLAPSIASLFDCLSGRDPECTTDFLPQTCDPQYEELSACLLDQGR